MNTSDERATQPSNDKEEPTTMLTRAHFAYLKIENQTTLAVLKGELTQAEGQHKLKNVQQILGLAQPRNERAMDMKPVIIVLSSDDDDRFDWLSEGWYQQHQRGQPEAEALMPSKKRNYCRFRCGRRK